MSTSSFPAEIWLHIRTYLDGPSHRAMSEVSRWHYEEYTKSSEEFLRALEETVPVPSSLIDRPLGYEPGYIYDWQQNTSTPFERLDDPVWFRAYTMPQHHADRRASSTKIHFNFQNRPRTRYVVDFEKWEVAAMEMPPHTRNTNRESSHRLILNNETNALEEVSLEDDDNGELHIIWKTSHAETSIKVPWELYDRQDCWLADRPKSIDQIVFYARYWGREENLTRAFYVNWKTKSLDYFCCCNTTDFRQMAMKNSLAVAMCNGYFISTFNFGFVLSNTATADKSVFPSDRPHLVYYDNRYVIYRDEEGDFILDVKQRTIRPLAPKNVLKAIPSIHAISITEKDGALCWVPGWTSLGLLKPGTSKPMIEGLVFGYVRDGEVLYPTEDYNDVYTRIKRAYALEHGGIVDGDDVTIDPIDQTNNADV